MKADFEEIKHEYEVHFGKEPNIIGMFWNNPEKLKKNISEAIEKNEEYDEYQLLSKEDQELYDDGMLMF